MSKSLGEHYNDLLKEFMKSLTPKERKIIDSYSELSRQVMSTPSGSKKFENLHEKQKVMFKKYPIIRKRNDLRWQ